MLWDWIKRVGQGVAAGGAAVVGIYPRPVGRLVFFDREIDVPPVDIEQTAATGGLHAVTAAAGAPSIRSVLEDCAAAMGLPPETLGERPEKGYSLFKSMWGESVKVRAVLNCVEGLALVHYEREKAIWETLGAEAGMLHAALAAMGLTEQQRMTLHRRVLHYRRLNRDKPISQPT